LDWPLLQQRVAELKAEPWSPFAERRNDEGRDLALYVTRALAATPWPSWANCPIAAVAKAVARTERRIAQSAATRTLYQDLAATFKLKT
jgi:hypothetical protein